MVHIWQVEAPYGGLSLTSLLMHMSNTRLTNRARRLIFGTQGQLLDQNILPSFYLSSEIIDPNFEMIA